MERLLFFRGSLSFSPGDVCPGHGRGFETAAMGGLIRVEGIKKTVKGKFVPHDVA